MDFLQALISVQCIRWEDLCHQDISVQLWPAKVLEVLELILSEQQLSRYGPSKIPILTTTHSKEHFSCSFSALWQWYCVLWHSLVSDEINSRNITSNHTQVTRKHLMLPLLLSCVSKVNRILMKKRIMFWISQEIQAKDMKLHKLTGGFKHQIFIHAV